MYDKRCAWCGEKMRDQQILRTFCSKTCQHNFEAWSRTRAVARIAAVHRWRDLPIRASFSSGDPGQLGSL